MNFVLRGITFLALILWALPVSADIEATDTEYRGFQLAHVSLTAEDIQALKDDHNMNLARTQIGNDAEMDGTTGQAYIDMIDASMDEFDEKIDAFTSAGIKLALGLYSPPSGFSKRAAPSHHAMFSNAALQDDFVAMWERIIRRYEDRLDDFYCFDLLTEPAVNSKVATNGAPSWNDLLQRTITAIRAISEDVPICVKSIYGDPTKLAKLPAIDDENIIYSYHAYPFGKYQHTGVASDPFSVTRPEQKKVRNKILNNVALFLKKHDRRFRNGQVPTQYPLIHVGELASSACATGNAQFLDDLIGVIERDDLDETSTEASQSCKERFSNIKKKKKRKSKIKRCKAKKKKKKSKKKNGGNSGDDSGSSGSGNKEFRQRVRHHSWAYHAYAESRIWDPRYVCDNAGELSLQGETERYDVLDEYYARNTFEESEE